MTYTDAAYKMEAHRQEAALVAATEGRCPHGNAKGYSNYDAPFCGACEVEAEQEAAMHDAIDTYDTTGRWPFTLGPFAPEVAAPAPAVDDVPF